METAVRKATRLEYLPPKQKHLITLKNFTIENPSSADSIILSLEKRLKEQSWIITYKVLVIVHYLMREGNSVQVTESVMKHPSVFDTSRIKNTSSAPASVQNIHLYVAYLNEKIVAYRHLKRDYIKESVPNKEGRLRHLSVPNGLLKETSALQRQIENVLCCKFYLDEKDPSITLFAYRMVIDDLLSLFRSVNEGVINILEHYFEMDKKDAAEALEIYKTFSKQTELTIIYLNEARKLKSNLELNIPALNHAPLSLATALEEYLHDDTSAKENNTKPSASSEPIQTNQPPLQQQQFFTQPIQQQPQYTGQPTMFPPSNYPSQQVVTHTLQNDPFASFVSQQNTASLPMQSTSPASNPFLTMMSQPQQQQQQQQQQPIHTNYSNSPYNNTFSQQQQQQQQGYSIDNNNLFLNSSNLSRSNSVAIGNHFSNSNMNRANTISVGNTNPFRSLSTSETMTHFQPNFQPQQQQQQQQLTVVKPAPYQLSQPTYSNPFSPATPPLTPNRQSLYNNNMFMVPEQHQQPQRSSTLPVFSSSSPNPFMTQ